MHWLQHLVHRVQHLLHKLQHLVHRPQHNLYRLQYVMHIKISTNQLMHAHKRIYACITVQRYISSDVHMNITYVHRVYRGMHTHKYRQTGIPFRTEGCIGLLDIALLSPPPIPS